MALNGPNCLCNDNNNNTLPVEESEEDMKQFLNHNLENELRFFLFFFYKTYKVQEKVLICTLAFLHFHNI